MEGSSLVAVPSTKPYLLRALYDWCSDNGLTPFLHVAVDSSTQVPQAYVKDAQITLNVSCEATQNLAIENDWITFVARFGGIPMSVRVPVARVMAIYARENGVGMGFEVEEDSAETPSTEPTTSDAFASGSDDQPQEPDSSTGAAGSRSGVRRPGLKRIK